MNKRHFIPIFISSLIAWWIGSGLLPLLPIYATKLGASPALVGNYLSIAYLMLAMGTASAGWLASKLQRRRGLFILSSVVCVPATYLMGQATNIWQLTIFTSIVWFAAGGGLTLLAILTGRLAEAGQRGKLFGALALTTALGGLLGGFTTGPIADHWGYPTLFGVLSFLWLGQIVSGLFLRDKTASDHPSDQTLVSEPRKHQPIVLSRRFLQLLIVNLLAGTAIFVLLMGQSLAMNGLGFNASAITIISALSGIVGVGLNPLMGRLSDRIHRGLLLSITYVGSALALVMVALASSLFDFALVALLVAVQGAGAAIGAALVADVLGKDALDRGMGFFDAAKWAGGICGFAGTGYAVQLLGLQTTLLAGALLPLLALTLLALTLIGNPSMSTGTQRLGSNNLVAVLRTLLRRRQASV
jgi:predicted MFS family arabinose efflux permease